MSSLVKIAPYGLGQIVRILTNHLSSGTRVSHRARTLTRTARGYILCVVLGAELGATALVGRQSAAGSPQDAAVTSVPPSGGAAIAGTVTDQSGTALRGARVTLTNERTAAHRVVVTAENGAYLFAPVDGGTYTLATELSGFENAVRSHLAVSRDQHLSVEFSLARQVSSPSRQTADGVNSGAIAADSLKSNLNRNSRIQDQKSAEPRAPEGPKASSDQLVGQRTADRKAGSAPRFDYDDKPSYKPGEAASSTQPGGYSSGAIANSYDLILDYVETWHAQAGDGQEPVSIPQAREEDGRAAADERRPAGGATKDKGRDALNGWEPLPQGQPPGIDEAVLEAWNENQFFSHGSDMLLHRAFAPASEVFQRGVARFPESAKLLMGLGIALYARGLYDQAVSVLVHATDMVPSDPRPYLLLAKAYNASRSDHGEVAERLERWVALDSKSAPARYYYALSLWRGARGKPGANPAQIENLLRSATALDPHFVEAILELGALYAEREEYSNAIREFRRAIAINPDLAAAHYRLAQAYARTGDRAAAQTELDLYEHLQQKQSVDRR